MYVDAKLVEEAEGRFGKPHILHWEHETGEDELAFVKATQKHGRAHDVTLFIFSNDHLALIRKPMFQRPIYRAPSGGLNRGESFEEGAKREALEETGLEIELEEHLLRIHVRFKSEDDYLDWTSDVFKARAALGFITLFFGIGQASGTFLGGRVADFTGSYTLAFVIAGAAALVGAVASLFLRPPSKAL